MNRHVTYLLDATGQPTSPATAADLAAILAPLLPATQVREVTVSLAAALDAQPLDLGDMALVQAVAVKALTGAASLRFGAPTAPLVPLAAGESRDRLALAGLYLSSPGGGGSVTFELQGR